MKALTIREPWVTCILQYDKRIENRNWRLPQGMQGKTIAIHTAKKVDKASYAAANALAGVNLRMARPILPLGCIVATARIVKCVSKSPDKWFFGPYGFVLDEIKPLVHPLAVRGALGFWNVPPDVESYLLEGRDGAE